MGEKPSQRRAALVAPPRSVALLDPDFDEWAAPALVPATAAFDLHDVYRATTGQAWKRDYYGAVGVHFTYARARLGGRLVPAIEPPQRVFAPPPAPPAPRYRPPRHMPSDGEAVTALVSIVLGVIGLAALRVLFESPATPAIIDAVTEPLEKNT